MSSPSSRTFLARTSLICAIFIFLSSINITFGRKCFKSIISFGDSYADTGNLVHLTASDVIPKPAALPPYGETFFHHPTGRFSNGRLVIDFIAQHFGLPFVPPYFGVNNETKQDFGKGVNFAVGGATALDYTYLAKRNISTKTTFSLGTELAWFRKMVEISRETTSSNRYQFLQSSLVLMGEIGGNDIAYALLQGKTKEDVQLLVPPIINAIKLAINELIEFGVVTIMVPGNIPAGCLTTLLAYYSGSDKRDYDPSTGCLIWLNKFVQNYNKLLRIELNHIQKIHPHVTIIYADYYNALMRVYTSPKKYGLIDTLKACCGSGGLYNYNSSVTCGHLPSNTSCDYPSRHLNWDGTHMTEATYKLLAKGLLEGPYSIPHINRTCSSINIHE